MNIYKKGAIMQGTQIPHQYIRQAEPSDFKQVALLIVQAMNDLAGKFTGSNKPDDAIPLFEYFFQLDNNQYSYKNTLVYEIDKQIAGSITAYDGGLLHSLRLPFLEYIKNKYQLSAFNLEDETQAGEFYLDTVSVSPSYQGKGLGSELIKAATDWARSLGYQNAGLLVDIDNPMAQKLYTRLGFKVKSDKDFMGGRYQHMQIELM